MSAGALRYRRDAQAQGDVGGQVISAGLPLAGQRVTLRLDGPLAHILSGATVACTAACPVPGPCPGPAARGPRTTPPSARFRATAMPTGHATGFPPHVTIVHPRTSRHGTQAWAELASMRLDDRITITQVAITAYDGDRWPTLQTIPLTGRQPPD